MNTLKDCVLVGYVHIMPISFIPKQKKSSSSMRLTDTGFTVSKHNKARHKTELKLDI